jgi:hypothetical protein
MSGDVCPFEPFDKLRTNGSLVCKINFRVWHELTKLNRAGKVGIKKLIGGDFKPPHTSFAFTSFQGN